MCPDGILGQAWVNNERVLRRWTFEIHYSILISGLRKYRTAKINLKLQEGKGIKLIPQELSEKIG